MVRSDRAEAARDPAKTLKQVRCGNAQRSGQLDEVVLPRVRVLKWLKVGLVF